MSDQRVNSAGCCYVVFMAGRRPLRAALLLAFGGAVCFLARGPSSNDGHAGESFHFLSLHVQFKELQFFQPIPWYIMIYAIDCKTAYGETNFFWFSLSFSPFLSQPILHSPRCFVGVSKVPRDSVIAGLRASERQFLGARSLGNILQHLKAEGWNMLEHVGTRKLPSFWCT